jgi:phage baseplate assembly protein V
MYPKFGIITEVDFKKAQCKVALRDERTHSDGEKFETGWLFVAAARAKGTKSYWMPKKGEGVVCFLDETCSEGVVLCSVFTKDTAPTSEMEEGVHVTHYADGTVIKYDENSSEFTIKTVGKVNITADGDITIKAASSTVKIQALNVEVKATTAKIEAATATIKATAGEATLLDTFTGLTKHLFVPSV